MDRPPIEWVRRCDQPGVLLTAILGEYQADLLVLDDGRTLYRLSQGPVIWRQGRSHYPLPEVQKKCSQWLRGERVTF